MTQLAHRLNRRIKLEQIGETPNGLGDYDTAYTLIATVWAEVKPLSGKQYISDTQISEKPTHKFTVRFRRDLKKDHFILLTEAPTEPDRRFRIFSITNAGERNEYLEILAEEIEEQL